MNTLKAVINLADERLQVRLSPALKNMEGGPLQEAGEIKEIKLVSLVDDRTFEPALFYNPYYIIPSSAQDDQYIRFLQALRHTDKFALVYINGNPEQPTGLIYPCKHYLILVFIRSNAELAEPEAPDWTADAVTLTSEDVANLRVKMENLKQTNAQALGAYGSR